MRFFAGMNLDRLGKWRGFRGRALAGGFVLAALLAWPAPSSADENRNHFDSDSLMRAPGFFDLVVLGGPGQARWLVLTDSNPPSAPNRLVQTQADLPAGTIAAAIRRNLSFRDGTVSTFVRQGPGHAGMVLRMQDERNFLLVVVDTASGEAVLSGYSDGKPSELGRGRGSFPFPWQQLSVKLAGPAVSVEFGGKPVFEAKDPRPHSGRAGLAAEGPGEASFDEFVLDPAP